MLYCVFQGVGKVAYYFLLRYPQPKKWAINYYSKGIMINWYFFGYKFIDMNYNHFFYFNYFRGVNQIYCCYPLVYFVLFLFIVLVYRLWSFVFNKYYNI